MNMTFFHYNSSAYLKCLFCKEVFVKNFANSQKNTCAICTIDWQINTLRKHVLNMLLYLFKDSYFAFYVLIVILFVCLFSSALNWVIQRYSNNIEIGLFLETLQTRKLLSLCQFLPCLLPYIAPNDRVIKTKSGLQKVDKRWMVMNLYSTSSYKASKKYAC